MLEALLDRFRHGDRFALARLLSLVARGDQVPELVDALGPAPVPGRVVAFTGSAGVGKSTLIGRLIEVIRGQGKRVAVLACDPQSPVSGGALLGDRFRMGEQADDGVFIRSLATPGGQGAVAAHLEAQVRLLEAFGFDVVLIETVGSGQGDTRVHELVDVLVLLVQPETGDDLQWEKAGVLEVADLVFIQKADLPGAERVEAQVRSMLSLTHAAAVPILRGSARTGAGIPELWEAIVACPLRRQAVQRVLRDLLPCAQAVLEREFDQAVRSGEGWLPQLLESWQAGRMNRNQVGAAVLDRFAGKLSRSDG